MVKRDNFTVMLAQTDASKTFIPNWQIVEKMWDVYFWVDDADAIYAEFQASGAIIDYSLYYRAARGQRIWCARFG